ncbi:hypothetical protein ABH940_006860 [Streptacidiphilus sp. BW17]|uniref:TnsA-like heteromeric transposase endonuclease subunit n=1 Tax=Streptacidiphilus sp. BW17 TaxID=3156274 RepID=UPI0035178EB6
MDDSGATRAAGAGVPAVEAAFASGSGRVAQLRWEQAAAAVRFEDLGPVSAFPVIPGKRWGPGSWWSATTGRHVAHGSAAMLVQLMLLDRDRSVTGLAGRPVRMVWREEDGSVRSWVPQLFARYADGSGMLADCPGAPGAGGVRARRAGEVLAVACGQVGWVYRRLEPPGLVVAGNVRWLAGYRHPRHRGRPGLLEAVLEAFSHPRPLTEGAAVAGEPLEVLPVVFHALWCGYLDTAVGEVLHERIRVGPGRSIHQPSAEAPSPRTSADAFPDAGAGGAGTAAGVGR